MANGKRSKSEEDHRKEMMQKGSYFRPLREEEGGGDFRASLQTRWLHTPFSAFQTRERWLFPRPLS